MTMMMVQVNGIAFFQVSRNHGFYSFPILGDTAYVPYLPSSIVPMANNRSQGTARTALTEQQCLTFPIP